MGNSGCLLCWTREVQSSIRVAKESWALLSSHCRANRPHLGLCPESNVPLQGRQGSRGCIPDSTGSQASSRVEAKNSALLSSRDGYLLEPPEWPKGSQASCGVWRENSGLFPRACRNEGPHLEMTGESRCFSRAAAPVGDFSRGTTASSGILSWGARDVGSPCEGRGGGRHCS